MCKVGFCDRASIELLQSAKDGEDANAVRNTLRQRVVVEPEPRELRATPEFQNLFDGSDAVVGYIKAHKSLGTKVIEFAK